MTILIFGGTAAYSIDPTKFAEQIGTKTIETPFGTSPHFRQLRTKHGTAVWFSSRHGDKSLSKTARFVNHRANIWAAKELGTKLILSWNGVGAINENLSVGDAVVPSGLMDWTRHRHSSFEERARHSVTSHIAAPLRQAARTINHIENGRPATTIAHPFSPTAQQAILDSTKGTNNKITYVCTEGPRLETAAEIQLAAELGADIVGMTLCPEVWLAAELGIGYASLGLITNFATGRWHIDPRRDFGATVAQRGLTILLTAVDQLASHT